MNRIHIRTEQEFKEDFGSVAFPILRRVRKIEEQSGHTWNFEWASYDPNDHTCVASFVSFQSSPDQADWTLGVMATPLDETRWRIVARRKLGREAEPEELGETIETTV